MANERVLLVDDEKEFVEVLKERLESRGLRVTTALDGTEALEVVKKKRFDAIILDFQMPGMDGVETLREILATDSDAQVILLTGHGSVGASVQALKGGAVDFMEKPADINALLEKIGEAAVQRTILLEQRSMEMIEDIIKKKGW
jgi:DNA-binding NtrC family response regulator